MTLWIGKIAIKATLMVSVLTIAGFPFYALSQTAYFAPVDNLNPKTLSRLLERYRGQPYKDFNHFALDVYITGKRFFAHEQHDAIGDYVANKRIRPSETFIIHRLFGVYARLKYGGEARRMLGKLVSIPTYAIEGVPQHKNPNFIRFEKTIAAYAKEFGLRYKNVGGRVYEVSLPGRGGELVGLHAHGDVVPANSDLWVLSDGTKLDPFHMTQVGGKLYGRGTQDDKNGIVAAMIAMRIIEEEKIRLVNDFKLLIDTTEETPSSSIPYYLKRHKQPEFNIALDGRYPVVIAEKGSAVIIAKFPVNPTSKEGNNVVSLTGGLAINQIPAASSTVINSKSSAQLAARISNLGTKFVADNGDDFKIIVSQQSDDLVIDVIGEPAHSYDPASGINPVSRMLLFINLLRNKGLINENHFTSAAAYLTDNWGLDFYGNKLKINYKHSFMGPLTAVPTLIKVDDNSLELALDLRLPAGKPLAEIEAKILQQLVQWSNTTSTKARFKFEAVEPMYRNPREPWLDTMLDVASENLDLPRQFASSSGAMSVHSLPNGVQFGLARPDEKYTGHKANEYKTIDQFLLDLQIVTELLMRIGLMKELH